tara:strand:- start:750 stop:1397 length:648 start_codon:yes stop_codon:yes gene_type:complete
MKVRQIKNEETHDWFKKLHYAKRLPITSYAFGLYKDYCLIGVVSYGNPTGRSVLEAMTNKNYEHPILELNRLCLLENKKNYASFLIGNSLKLLPKPNIIISYADMSMSHTGYVYQATNFMYCGLSEKRTDWLLKGSNKHQRGITSQYTYEEMKSNKDKFEYKERARKHRYIYYLGTKKQKRQFLSCLNYEIQPYPKAENKNYQTNYIPQTQMALI